MRNKINKIKDSRSSSSSSSINDHKKNQINDKTERKDDDQTYSDSNNNNSMKKQSFENSPLESKSATRAKHSYEEKEAEGKNYDDDDEFIVDSREAALQILEFELYRLSRCVESDVKKK
jgi:hypothetical protein